MLREEVVEWISKTFGKSQGGDRFEMACKISEISKKGNKVQIEELSFVFQRKQNDPGEKEVKKWKRELADIINTKLIAFNFRCGDFYVLADEVAVQKGAEPGDLIKTKTTMLNVGLCREKILNVELLIPSFRRN